MSFRLDLSPRTEGAETHRNLVMLLLDTSGSMAISDAGGQRRIDALSAAVRRFVLHDLPGVPAVKRRGELAIGTFGRTPMEWHDLGGGPEDGPFTPFSAISTLPSFGAAGLTPLADAIEHGVAAMRQRVEELRRREITIQYLPMIYLVTDGEPSAGQDMERAVRLLQASAFRRPKPEFLFVALGVHEANDRLMERLAPRSYYPLRDISLQELMKFITASIFSVTGGGGGASGEGQGDFSDTRDEYDLIGQTLENYRDFQY